MVNILRHWLQKFMANTQGFTLAEAAISLGILSLGVGLIGATVFHVLSIQRFWQDDMVANKDARHAASWFAEDALKATNTNLVDGNPPATSVTLVLESGNVVYSLSGNDLVRQAGGNETIVATDVVSVEFSLSEQVLTFSLEVNASRGGTETLTLLNYLRLLGT